MHPEAIQLLDSYEARLLKINPPTYGSYLATSMWDFKKRIHGRLVGQ